MSIRATAPCYALQMVATLQKRSDRGKRRHD